MGKLPQMTPNGARKIFVPTNPDLADILGRTNLDFEIFVFFGPQVSGCPGPQNSQILKFSIFVGPCCYPPGVGE